MCSECDDREDCIGFSLTYIVCKVLTAVHCAMSSASYFFPNLLFLFISFAANADASGLTLIQIELLFTVLPM